MLATTKLKELGLTPSEIKVYLYLLEKGESEPTLISGATKIQRTNCYNILKQLRVRDLVQKHSQKRPITYSANSPTFLLSDIEYRKDIIELILPELNNLYRSSDNKPVIKIHEGKEEVKDIFYQILDAKELLGFAATNTLHDLYPGFFTGEWPEKFKKRGGFLRDILIKQGENEAAQNIKKLLGDSYEYKILPETYRDIWTDLLVWDDNVALINLTNPVFGTVIQNKQIADMMRLMFELIWKSLNSTTPHSSGTVGAVDLRKP